MSASDSEQLLRIGQVCSILQPEFPDISISKLRFLEEQGLVEPERTPGGYRMYNQEHMRQLREILEMQRDEFLPLKVIRDELQRRLDGAPRRRRAGRPAEAEGAPSARMGLGDDTRYVDRGAMLDRLGVSVDFVAECQQYGLVGSYTDSEGRPVLRADDAEILVKVAHLKRFGIEPRNLRQLQQATRRQASVIEQFAAPRLATRNPEQKAAAVRATESLASIILELAGHIFVRDLRLVVQGEAAPALLGGVQGKA